MTINKEIIAKITIALILILSTTLLLYNYGLKSKRNIRIIYISKTVDTSVAFWNTVNLGMQTAAKEYDVDIEYDGPQKENEVDVQNSQIRDAILKKPDIIILAAANYTSQLSLCNEIVDSGIMLLTVDSDIDSAIRTSFIGTNNFEAGKYAGQALSDIVSDEGKIAILSFVQGTATAIDREKGFLSGLNDKQRENIIGTFYCNGIEKDAFTIAKGIVEHNPDLEGLVCLNEPAASGGARALKTLDATTVKMVGIDSSLTAIKALEEGVINTLVVQKPFNMGYLSVVTAINAYNGKKTEEIVDTGTQVITKENMYSKENQKLLFIFADTPESR